MISYILAQADDVATKSNTETSTTNPENPDPPNENETGRSSRSKARQKRRSSTLSSDSSDSSSSSSSSSSNESTSQAQPPTAKKLRTNTQVPSPVSNGSSANAKPGADELFFW